MPKDLIPIELQKFIVQYIHSVEQLEILCVLVEDPNRYFSESDVFKSIQSSPESVSQSLRYFATANILVFDPVTGYRFCPGTPELERLTLDLLNAYRERRVSIIEMIYKMPLDPMQQFADAFKIRKDK